MAKKYTAEDFVNLVAKNKLDELEHATKDMSQHAIRGNLSNAASLVMQQHDNLGIQKALKEAKKQNEFELLKKALLKDTDRPEVNLQPLYEKKIVNPRLKVFKDANPGADLGYMELEKKVPVVNINESKLDIFEPEGLIGHEADHTIDEALGFIPDDEQKIMNAVKKKGLGNATDLFKGHHKRGFFELENLKKLVANKKLQASIPLVGQALGAYSMLESGDVFAADPTGMLSSDSVGEGSDQLPDEAAKDIFNARMRKTKQKLNDFSNLRKLD